MLTTILLRALTILILVDGMSNQSLDRLDPNWATGGFKTLRDEGSRTTLVYPEDDIVGDEAIQLLLSGRSEENAPTLADLMRIRHGYNSRTLVIGQDSARVTRMGRHCADRVLWLENNDTVVNKAIEWNRKYRLGEGQDYDILILELKALSTKACSDILHTDADERAYYALNADLERLIRNIPAGERTQYILIGIPHYGVGADLMERVHMPLQNYDEEQILALTSAYLMALHGHEKWIQSLRHRTLRLNHTAIAKSSIDLRQIAQQAADFLVEFSAIRTALPDANGDIHFELEPAYTPYWGSPFVTYPLITFPKRETAIRRAEDLIQNL